MTSRQARKLRREQERKAKKAAYKTGLQPSAPAAPTARLDDEFSPEFLAAARAMRERVERRVSLNQQRPTPPASGFVPQTAPAAPASRAQTNRANAAHSTGPRSPEGKLASSRNSLKHGLASGQLLIPGEDPSAFESLLESLLADYQPATTAEELLVQEMAQSYWLMQRALRLQNECLTAAGDDERTGRLVPVVRVQDERTGRSAPVVRVQDTPFALFLRYHTTHQRAFHKSLHLLLRMQKDRRRAGSVSRQHRPARPTPADTQAQPFVSQSKHAPGPKPGFVSQTRPSAAIEPQTHAHFPSPDRIPPDTPHV